MCFQKCGSKRFLAFKQTSPWQWRNLDALRITMNISGNGEILQWGVNSSSGLLRSFDAFLLKYRWSVCQSFIFYLLSSFSNLTRVSVNPWRDSEVDGGPTGRQLMEISSSALTLSIQTFGIRWICVIGFCQFGTFSNDWSFEDTMARLNCTVIKREQSN